MTNQELLACFDTEVFEHWYENLTDHEKDKLNEFEPNEEYLYDQDL